MRIVTRPDFDGVVSAVLLRVALGKDCSIKWVEPNEIDQKKVDIREGDVIANLPYDDRCSMWFDHHISNRHNTDYVGAFKLAPSAARVIYDYYPEELKGFNELVFHADKIDSADLNQDEIKNPENYPHIILSMTITGGVNTEPDYLEFLVNALMERDASDLLKEDSVKSRLENVIDKNTRFKDYLYKHTVVNEGVAVTDFRDYDEAPSGNRFLVYSLFPESHVSVKIRKDGGNPENAIISVGHSIINRSCNVNVGLLVSRYGGGGHKGAGSCSFDSKFGDQYLKEITEVLRINKETEISG